MSRPWLPVPPLQPETSNYLWGGCCTQQRLHPAWQAQPSLNDTLPACPLCWSRRGGGPAGLSCGFFFHCVRPQGPACPPAHRWAGAEGPTLTRPTPTLDMMCSPFRGSRGFQPEGELGLGGLPRAGGGAPLPCPLIAHWLSSLPHSGAWEPI